MPEEWSNLLDLYISSLPSLDGNQGKNLKSVLFLIPVVVAIGTTQEHQDDFFEIVELGKILELMIQTKLISREERFSTLTHLFSSKDIVEINETAKFELLKALTFDAAFDPKFLPQTTPVALIPNQLDMKLKFIVCTEILKLDSKSHFSRLIDPCDSDVEEHLEEALRSLKHFLKLWKRNFRSLSIKKVKLISRSPPCFKFRNTLNLNLKRVK